MRRPAGPPWTRWPRSGQSKPRKTAASRPLPDEQSDRHCLMGDGAGALGGPSEAEPGAGSAGRGAGRRRLDLSTGQFGNVVRSAGWRGWAAPTAGAAVKHQPRQIRQGSPETRQEVRAVVLCQVMRDTRAPGDVRHRRAEATRAQARPRCGTHQRGRLGSTARPAYVRRRVSAVTDLSQLTRPDSAAGHDVPCRREDDDLPDESI